MRNDTTPDTTRQRGDRGSTPADATARASLEAAERTAERTLFQARLIVAQVGEQAAGEEVRQAATALAEDAHARLVLYDADANSAFADPMPSNWSAEGDDETFGDVLSPDDLELLGRPELRDAVRTARERGIDAYGWLAGARGVDSITEYATQIGADLVLIPADAAQRDVLDLGEEDVLREARELPPGVRVGLVEPDGSITIDGREEPR